jgi:DNA-binding transcriptional LysR family regulator
MTRWFEEQGSALDAAHEFDSHHDLVALLRASGGLAIVPESAPRAPSLMRAKLGGLSVGRTVFVYAAAGRQRSPAAAAFLNLLRAADFAGVAA